MIELVTASLSDQMSFDEFLSILKGSPAVDGFAQFGSHAVQQANAASDYDLLILVTALPAPVFQLVTTVDGRLADIVLVDITLADRLLTEDTPTDQPLFERLFLQKMGVATILFDQHERLLGIQRLSQHVMTKAAQLSNEGETAYQVWFWQGFGLLHLTRMAHSSNPVHQAAADMMLFSCLVSTWRSYFALHNIAWEGEKAAIRYWLQHDIACYELLQAVLAAQDRMLRLQAYAQFVHYVLAPVGAVMNKGETALVLTGANQHHTVRTALLYWNGLLTLKS